MAQMLTDKDFADVKRDIDDIGDSVNEKKIIYPRYGAPYRSIPLVTEDIENTINEWDAAVNTITQEGGVPDLAVLTWSGRTQADKNKETPSPFDFGAAGDGVTDDTQAFTDLESYFADHTIDLFGRDYLADFIPSGNKYTNGYFIVSSSRYNADDSLKNNSVVIGENAGRLRNKTSKYNSVVIGKGALENNTNPRNTIAIGMNAARHSGPNVNHNIAIGLETQLYVNGDGDGTSGTRNVAIGANAQRFVTTGHNNISIGRNSGQSITTGASNTAIGSNAIAGQGSLTFDGNVENIRNLYPIEWSQMTALGSSAMYLGGAQNCVAVGTNSLRNAKSIDTGNVAFGVDTLLDVGATTTYDGKVLVPDTRAGTYTMSANSITFTLTAHGFTIGQSVLVSIPNLGTTYADPQRYNIQSITADTFTVTDTYAVAGQTGTFNMIHYGTNTNAVASINNVAIGVSTMDAATGSYNVAVGPQALRKYIGDSFVAIGRFAAGAVTTGGLSQAIGNGAFQNSNNVTSSVGIGSAVANNIATIDESTLIGRQAGDIGTSSGVLFRCTALGAYSMRLNVDGSSFSSRSNSTAIGSNSRTSGDNQVQLGDSATTTYVYGTVQNRSDARDKTDIRDTELGLDFINSLRPVDYKWDMREDYIETLEDGKVIKHDKDGSKKRTRYHHGFIAQEVPEGFGGYQDHKVQGGADVLSLGYDEFIAPLVKAVQELTQRVKDLEAEKQK